MACFIAFTASAQVPEGLSIDNDFAEGEDGYYYVNMTQRMGNEIIIPKITIPESFTSTFKVYDAGGKNGNYPSQHDSYLQLTAPAGCALRLTGNVTTEYNIYNDYLEVYDGTSLSSPSLGKFSSPKKGEKTEFDPIVSTQQTMTLYFGSWGSDVGLDLTVTIVGLTNHEITVNTVTGGTVTIDKNSAIAHETVTLTATPSEGYLLNKIVVSDGSNTYPVSGGGWLANTATFTMPNADVTVTPVFTNNNWTADEGLFVSMFDSKDLVANIPIGMQSFKVIYGDGSKTESYTNATLKLTAPEGYLIQLSGKVSVKVITKSPDEKSEFVVYDGENTSTSKLVQYYANQQDINNQPIEVVSTGKEVYIRCHTGWSDAKWNLDLTVTLNPIDEPHSVIVSNSISNGGIVTDKTSAKPNTTVNLTVTPDEGYVLESINVTDANGKINLTPSYPNASFGDVNYFTTSNFSFAMRTADATVSATFMPKTDFYVRIPKENQRDFTIPEGTTSFKVYHTPWGGSAEHDDYYVNNNNGYLLLNAPEGFKMKVSGKAYLYPWSSMVDYFEIFDGNTNTVTSLGKTWVSSGNTYKDVNAQSSGNHLLLYFYSDGGGYAKGLNLTVTLIVARKSVEDLTITIPAQTYNGSAVTPVVTVQDGNTTLTEGTDYTIEYSNNTNAGTSAKATITGKGNYTGTVEKTFTINPRVTISGALALTEYGNRTTAEIQGDFTNISSEGKSLEISKPRTVDKVIFKRSFSKGIPATIMLPFNFTLDASIGSFYTIESVAKNDNGEWIATPKVVTGTLQANTPYMFKAAKDLKELSFTDENGITLQSTSTIEINTNGDWTLHGVYQKTMLDGYGEFNYGFAGQAVTADGISVGDFIRAGEGVWADPMRCYLTYKKGELTKAATVLPDRIRVVFPDEENSNNETTDIIENTETEDVVTPVSEFTPESGVKVWSFDGTVYIEAQPDMDYTIVDLSGRTIKKGVTHSTREELNLNAKGIVIVKIGNKSFKLK